MSFRNFLLGFVTALSVLSIVACGKETDTSSAIDEPQKATPRLSEVSVSVMTVVLKYNRMGEDVALPDTSYESYVEQRWHWNGDVLSSIDYCHGDTIDYSRSFTFEDGLLVKAEDDDGFQTVHYRYVNGSIDSIIIVQRGFSRVTKFLYMDGAEGPYAAVIGDGENATYQLTWDNGNMTSYTWNAYNTTTTESYTFDDVYNPFYLLESNLNVRNLSRHNVLTKDYAYTAYGKTSRDHVDYHYTYGDNRPLTLHYVTTSQSGYTTIIETIKTYDYTYTYLPD
ncbi:MAG: hypothetical protein KBT04_00860 [Bacteroidales bacterium]|nr:hypothetical protein [Candidatus Colimorpha onthohippi]